MSDEGSEGNTGQGQEAPGLILAPISVGELFDKISILELKAACVCDPAARANVATELAALRRLRDAHGLSALVGDLADALAEVNRMLWDVEDAVRRHEAEGRFDEAFVTLARSVYRENDRRAALKRQISQIAKSLIVEEKVHFGAGS
ncbi:DUF6165 family protein [Xanthobacter sp. KR7-65]|uniref:DUF6165 family protein n=1 Tax=Xanthobacter sp. KR7-65 TaxID=3156612 RepID=UPI0032B4EA24